MVSIKLLSVPDEEYLEPDDEGNRLEIGGIYEASRKGDNSYRVYTPIDCIVDASWVEIVE
jgi:hypothetical protein